MFQRLLQIGLLVVVISVCSTCSAQIQRHRILLESQIGVSSYSGDRTPNGSTGLYNLVQYMGPSGRFGLGYRIWDNVDLIGDLSISTYDGIIDDKLGLDPIVKSNSSIYHTALTGSARLRIFPIGPFEPFLSGGLGLTLGKINGSRSKAIGPVLGLGVGLPLGKWHLFGLISQHYVFPNRAVDLAGIGRSPDVLSAVNVGIQYRLQQKPPKIGQISVSGPHSLTTNTEGVFQASTDLDPIEYSVRWDFGDGTSGTGHSIRHAYAQEGSYVVNAFISNERGTTNSSLVVEVLAVYSQVSLLSISIAPSTIHIGETVSFTPVLRGNEISCSWDFGDGATASDCETYHTYYRPGSYKIAFTASNPSHTAHSTQSIVVQNEACIELPDLVSVFFPANSSDLSLEMRQILRDNMATASACTERVIQVVGYAIESERRAQDLAENRAAQVYQYYRNLGISSDRVLVGTSIVTKAANVEGLPWSERTVTSKLVEYENR